MTRWRDEEAFKAWLSSPDFGQGHRSAAERAGGEAPKPVGVHSELWSDQPAGGSLVLRADARAASLTYLSSSGLSSRAIRTPGDQWR